MTPLLLTPDPVAEPRTITVPAGILTVELRHSGVTVDQLPGHFDSGYAVLAGLGPIGPGYAIYDGDPRASFDLTIGFPVDAVAGELPAGVVAAEFPAGPALLGSHLGPFEGLPGAWDALTKDPATQGATRCIEIYVTDPSATPVEDRRTDLLVPLG